MILSEAIKMLEENPKLKFIGTKGGFRTIKMWGYSGNFIYFEYVDEGYDGGKKVIEHIFAHYDWQLIYEPITWQEAMQAVVDGKVVVCENCKGCGNGNRCLSRYEKQIFSLSHPSPCWGQLVTGTWYIKE